MSSSSDDAKDGEIAAPLRDLLTSRRAAAPETIAYRRSDPRDSQRPPDTTPEAMPTVLAGSDALEAPSGLVAVRSPIGTLPPARLDTMGMLGTGGMGEVHRVRDPWLNRVLAMKVLLPIHTESAEMRTRFVEEAQVTAQLAHPSIPPIHALGELDDGRPYFTMKEVHGRTLGEVLKEHYDPSRGRDETWATGRRLLEIFQRICEAVAYAHARGVVHCDLKPANVMVGAFGEVLVMDWGVAHLVAPATTRSTTLPPVETIRARSEEYSFVGGTIGYMAPEQARGDVARVGPPSDVFALGVMLYEILAGRRPFRGAPLEMVQQAERWDVPALPAGTVADEALWAILKRALHPARDQRYADAAALAQDIALWREGALRREKALLVMREARDTLPHAVAKRAEAEALRREAASRHGELDRDAGVSEKGPIWAIEDRAAAIEHDAALALVRVTQLLNAALLHDPDLREAKALLARIHQERHADAERARAWDEAARHEILLRAHDVGEFGDYLEGRAELSVALAEPYRVHLYAYALRDRRLVPELVEELGVVDRVDRTLPIGSYVLEIAPPDQEGRSALYPIVLRRREGWIGVRPGDETPYAVALPEPESLAADDVYVAGGWFHAGGDPEAPGAGPSRRVWLDGFVVKSRPVTFRELATFLASPEGTPFRDGVHRDGLEVWRPDWPAVGMSWQAAHAYARWLSQHTGLAWRLPAELEWEKAARGVDGRSFPWGDFGDGAFCHVRAGERAPRTPSGIDATPADRSPYGVLGAAGNVRDWCADAFTREGARVRGGRGVVLGLDDDESTHRVVRGGSWRQTLDAARVAGRAGLVAGQGHPDVGFRLVRSVGFGADSTRGPRR